ncbi:MAG: PAS domain-containing protein, partial [Nitrospiraceae bacterium]
VMARVGAHLELARMRREAARRERELRMEAEALYHTMERGEQRLREQFEELNTIYQTAPVGLCLIDTAMRYVRINKALAAMNGVSVGATVGRSIRDVIPGFADVHEPLLRRVIDSKEPIVNVEVSGVMSQAPGVERVWITNYYPLTTADGSVSAISVVVQDITEQKRAEQSIRNLNQALILKVQDYEQAVRDLERSKVELEEKNRDLEQFHDVVVGRELKMMELEQALKRLTQQRGP